MFSVRINWELSTLTCSCYCTCTSSFPDLIAVPLLGPSSFFLSMSFFLHQFLSLIALALCHWQTPHLNSNSSSFFTLRFFYPLHFSSSSFSLLPFCYGIPELPQYVSTDKQAFSRSLVRHLSTSFWKNALCKRMFLWNDLYVFCHHQSCPLHYRFNWNMSYPLPLLPYQ